MAKSSSSERRPEVLSFRPAGEDDIGIWRALHADDDGFMYALPSSDQELLLRLRDANAHLAHDSRGRLVGCATLTPSDPGMGSFGILVAREARGMGHGSGLVAFVEGLARRLGIRVLRADVYLENEGMIHLLERGGWREYRNYEKNLDPDVDDWDALDPGFPRQSGSAIIGASTRRKGTT